MSTESDDLVARSRSCIVIICINIALLKNFSLTEKLILFFFQPP